MPGENKHTILTSKNSKSKGLHDKRYGSSIKNKQEWKDVLVLQATTGKFRLNKKW